MYYGEQRWSRTNVVLRFYLLVPNSIADCGNSKAFYTVTLFGMNTTDNNLVRQDSTSVTLPSHNESGLNEREPVLPVRVRPVTKIGLKPRWQLVDLTELWRYRELLLLLARRDVSVRYKQTILGLGWAFAQPLATMLVFAVFMGKMGGLGKDIEHYALFVFAGVLPWTFFSNSVAAGGQSVVANERLVTKVYFPRVIVPLSALGAPLFDLGIASGLLTLMMIYYGVVPDWNCLLLPVIVLQLLIAASGIGMFLSALIVAQRDFRFLLSFGVQLWMFATPCIYLDANTFSPTAQTWLPLNPAYGPILNFRATTLGQPIDWYALAVSGVVGLASLVVGLWYFRRTERSFADFV